jgi:hypothetical protein
VNAVLNLTNLKSFHNLRTLEDHFVERACSGGSRKLGQQYGKGVLLHALEHAVVENLQKLGDFFLFVLLLGDIGS